MKPSRPVLGLLFDALAHEHPRELWRGWLDFCAEHDVSTLGFLGGYLPSMAPLEGVSGPDHRNQVHDLVNSNVVDGLAIRLGALSRDDAEAQALCSRFAGLPLVNLTTMVAHHPTVTEDADEGIAAAVAHLVKVHGIRRIAYGRGPEGNPFAEARWQAFQKAFADQGLPLDPSLVTPWLDWSSASGEQAVRVLVDERKAPFQALITANDKQALGALEALRRRGLNVPHEVAVVGFDNLAEAAGALPPLTSLQYPSYELGRAAAQAALELAHGRAVEPVVKVASQLVVRSSCGCTQTSAPLESAPIRPLPSSWLDTDAASIEASLAALGFTRASVHVGTGESARRALVQRTRTDDRFALLVEPLFTDGAPQGHLLLDGEVALVWPLAEIRTAVSRAISLDGGSHRV